MDSDAIASTCARRSCPHCEGRELRRSRRRGFFERYLLSSLGLFPYRCDYCRERFYARRRKSADGEDLNLASGGNAGGGAVVGRDVRVPMSADRLTGN
jgi:hypothetical protein